MGQCWKDDRIDIFKADIDPSLNERNYLGSHENGLRPLPSATNFVTIDCGQDGHFARRVLAEVVARGVFIRMPFVAPHDRCIRVSLGDAAALEAFAAVLPQALAAARG